jgi:hypothetical protein
MFMSYVPAQGMGSALLRTRNTPDRIFANLAPATRSPDVPASAARQRRHLREHMTNFPRFVESRQRDNFRLGASAALLLFGLGALIANQMNQRVIMRHENNLSIAGFVVHRADTPDLQATLDLLPSHQVLQRLHGEAIRYVYADPDVCDCFYLGSQQAYDLYQKQRLARHLADKKPIAPRM